jgi:hypothetical protein
MSLGDDLDKLFFSEAVIDHTRKELDQDVFDDEFLKEHIEDYLRDIIDEIDNEVVRVEDAFIKGSILSYQWNDRSDIDLMIIADEDITDEQYEVVQDEVYNRYNGNKIPGTAHPLQVYVSKGAYNYENADGIYHLNKGWIKGPYDFEVDTNDYMSEFEEVVKDIDLDTGELRRELINYEMLRKLSPDEIENFKQKLKDSLKDIDSQVEDLVRSRQEIKDARHASKNALPSNVIQKMLERYYYMQMLDELNNIYEDEKVSDHEVDDVYKALQFHKIQDL